MQKLMQNVQAWRNRTTIRKQLSLLVGLVVGLAIAMLITFNFISQTRANETQQIGSLARVLALENQRLGSYVEELKTFSLQLRSNAGFMALADQAEPLSYAQRQEVETALKTAYYARGDLVQIELYLTKQKQRYAMDSDRRKVILGENVEISDLPDYRTFIAKPAFLSMTPDPKGLMCFTRAIVDVPRTTPLLALRFIVDLSAVEGLISSHRTADEGLCVFGKNGERYVTAEGLTEPEIAALLAGAQREGESYNADIGGETFLCAASRSADSAFVLVGFKSVQAVNASLIATRNASIAIGLAALALTVFLTETFIHYATAPLMLLAHRLRRVGTGNFKTRTDLRGSYEMTGLSEDVNRMMADIDQLIERTYVATLNERTAQLTALEAQTNPHFLFNTLQAIGSEALARGQSELYRMVTALAVLLRYAIRGGNLATLRDELESVEKYLFLQKARFGERLTYRMDVDQALLRLNVPKLGMLSLVENSIVHGLREQVETICIRITASAQGDCALLQVIDDGCGIPADKLARLNEALNDPDVTITQNVGLINLTNRFKLLYNGRARILLSSTRDPRETTVTLTIPLEVRSHV